MDLDSKNPCDLCKQNCLEFECALYGHPRKYSCSEWECFLNYEGTCMVGLYERCGAWEDT